MPGAAAKTLVQAGHVISDKIRFSTGVHALHKVMTLHLIGVGVSFDARKIYFLLHNFLFFLFVLITKCYYNSQLNLLSTVVKAQLILTSVQYNIKLCWPVARVFNYIFVISKTITLQFCCCYQTYDFLVFELYCLLEINILFGKDIIEVALWPEATVE